MGSRAWVHNGGYCFDNVDNRSPLWERRQPRALAPSPAKAGGEGARLRATGSRADERTPAVLAGRSGWGGVSSRSARTVRAPSQPPPSSAGGGAEATARRQRRRPAEARRGEEGSNTCRTGGTPLHKKITDNNK